MSKTVFEGAIGIDLGTTYSCVAVYKGNDVEIIANDQGSFTTPSFVSFSGDERLVGDAAKNQASMNPENTIFDVKRLIGRRFGDETVKSDSKSWPFKIVDQGGNPVVQVTFQGEAKNFTPQEISAMVLTKMKEIAEAKLDQTVKKAVVTVPAYFNDNQRQATKDAGSIAGLDVLRIINEPTAAAIAYGFGKENTDGRKVLIYDLGGGTFDVSLLTIEGQVFTVKATAGDTHLGGQDFDTNLLNFLKDVFQKQTGKDISGDARALRKLRSACERAKRTLSNAATTTVEVDSLFDGEDFEYNLSRARFEELNNVAFKSTLEPVTKVLADAKIEKKEVDAVVLVGGSTRIPKIQTLLQDFFEGKKLEKNINPDEAVAYGAAVQAGILTGQASSKVADDFLLLDVVPLSLGVAMEGNIFAPVVQRGQTVPTIKKRTFTTVVDNQSTVQFPVYQGERVNCEDNVSLGEFTLAPIPPMRAGEASLEVIFEFDTNGILKVTATEASTGRSANITISNAAGKLSQTEIEKMISSAQTHEKDDQQYKVRVEERRQLEELVNNLSKANIPKARAKRVENALNDVQDVLDNADADAQEIHKAWLSLKRLVLNNKIALPTA